MPLSPKKPKPSRSKAFIESRKQNSLESAEDYTELVHDLINKNGEARIVEIARILGISHVTAIRTVSRLEKAGYLKTKPRSPVLLTAKGQKMALESKDRHSLLVRFLIHIGVPREIAEKDTEGMEHHVSKTTLSAIKSYLGQK